MYELWPQLPDRVGDSERPHTSIQLPRHVDDAHVELRDAVVPMGGGTGMQVEDNGVELVTVEAREPEVELALGSALIELTCDDRHLHRVGAHLHLRAGHVR